MRDTCCFKQQGWGGHFKCTRREVSFKKAVFWKAFELPYVAQRNGNVPGFLSLPQIVWGLSGCPRSSMDNCISRGRRDGDGQDGQIFIGLKGKPNFPHVTSYLLGPCTCLAHALISLRIIMPGLIYAIRFIQMEDIKPCWCHVAIWNICPLPPPPRGSEEALKKKKGSRPFPLPLSDFCLDRAQTSVASINLFSFKAHVSGHFKGRIA